MERCPSRSLFACLLWKIPTEVIFLLCKFKQASFTLLIKKLFFFNYKMCHSQVFQKKVSCLKTMSSDMRCLKLSNSIKNYSYWHQTQKKVQLNTNPDILWTHMFNKWRCESIFSLQQFLLFILSIRLIGSQSDILYFTATSCLVEQRICKLSWSSPLLSLLSLSKI